MMEISFFLLFTFSTRSYSPVSYPHKRQDFYLNNVFIPLHFMSGSTFQLLSTLVLYSILKTQPSVCLYTHFTKPYPISDEYKQRTKNIKFPIKLKSKPQNFHKEGGVHQQTKSAD